MKWIQAGPAKIILHGTGFAITYHASQDMPFRLCHPHGERHNRGYHTLEAAKREAEIKARELIEMNLLSLEDSTS